MCLVVFNYKSYPKFKLILLANRDEFFNRPTKQAFIWENGIIGGQDLKAGGMWMGVNKSGRFAALTNYRNGFDSRSFKTSRGEFVKDYLNSNIDAYEFADNLSKSKDDYSGYNIIAGDVNKIVYYSNILNEVVTVDKGIHGLSNAFLNTEWFKVQKAKSMFAKTLDHSQNIDKERLLDILTDEEKCNLNSLPKTGINVELEYNLSSIFINLEKYGTVSSTLLTIDLNDKINFLERTYVKGIKNYIIQEFIT